MCAAEVATGFLNRMINIVLYNWHFDGKLFIFDLYIAPWTRQHPGGSQTDSIILSRQINVMTLQRQERMVNGHRSLIVAFHLQVF